MPWIITLHIVFLLIWSAALLYMPRLFIKEATAETLEERQQGYVMQRALYARVMTPSALLSVVAGGYLLFQQGFSGGWLPVKLVVVMLMVFFHVYCGTLMAELRHQQVRHRLWFYRALPAIPALLITAAVTLVVAKPF